MQNQFPPVIVVAMTEDEVPGGLRQFLTRKRTECHEQSRIELLIVRQPTQVTVLCHLFEGIHRTQDAPAILHWQVYESGRGLCVETGLCGAGAPARVVLGYCVARAPSPAWSWARVEI